MSLFESEKLLYTYKYNKITIKNIESSQKDNDDYFLDEELKIVKRELKIVDKCIDKIVQPYKSILIYRYFYDLTYYKIALKMNYSIQRIYQLRKEALIIFNEIIKEETNC